MEDFHEGWQRVNHLLGTPFGDLLLSSVQHTPSRGRFVEASLTAQTSLLLYLDPQEDFITSILFKSPLPQKQFDHMIFHNLVTLLVSLVSYNIDFKTFDAIFKPLKRISLRYIHSYTRISFTSVIRIVKRIYLSHLTKTTYYLRSDRRFI